MAEVLAGAGGSVDDRDARLAGRPGTAASAVRETEGSHPQLDSAPVTGGKLACKVLLVGSQDYLDDCLSQPDGGKDSATRLRSLLLEDALDLLAYPPQTGERVRHSLCDEPVRVSEPGAQHGVVLGDIVGERGDDTHGRLIVEPRSRLGLRMLLAVADDELKVTLQRRLDQLLVA